MIEAALSMNSDVKIDVSTPNGNGNPFYRKRHEGKIPVFTFHWRDDPRKDEAWYMKQKRDLDPVIVAQEIDIDYNASVGNVLINAEWVLAARERRIGDYYDDIPNPAPVVLGVDVARFGDDRTCIACRQGIHLHWIKVFQQKDTMEVVGEVRDILRYTHVDAVFVDTGGLGAGVYDRLIEEYDFIHGVDFGSKADESDKYMNKRAEIWGRQREWFRDEPVVIPNSNEIQTDLCSLQYSIDSNGRFVLEKKEVAKKRGVRSQDIGDSIALTFAEWVSHYDQWEDEVHHEGRSEVSGY